MVEMETSWAKCCCFQTVVRLPVSTHLHHLIASICLDVAFSSAPLFRGARPTQWDKQFVGWKREAEGTLGKITICQLQMIKDVKSHSFAVSGGEERPTAVSFILKLVAIDEWAIFICFIYFLLLCKCLQSMHAIEICFSSVCVSALFHNLCAVLLCCASWSSSACFILCIF